MCDTLLCVKPARNITFNLPVDLIRRAKVIAAERDTSLNAFVRDVLTQAVDRSGEYRQAGERLLAQSAAGLFEMPAELWAREELYD
jgi:plasmid stability protein